MPEGTVEAEASRIAANLRSVQERIAAAARRADRPPESVRVVVVTKGQPPEAVRLAFRAGVRHCGENRVEEALPKQAALTDMADLHWHMIGHIQSRKAEAVVPAFELVHSVDRMKLARLLGQHAVEAGRRLEVLLECNVSGEGSKSGWPLADPTRREAALEEMLQVADLAGLQVRGLMTMAPWSQDQALVRGVFRRLREARDLLAARQPGPWRELSMGMTDDFELAVEEGATMVRIGRAVFEPRPEGRQA